jgi:phospholipid-translocating ATPase
MVRTAGNFPLGVKLTTEPVEMELKKLHMGTIVFGFDTMDEVAHLLSTTFEDDAAKSRRQSSIPVGVGRTRRDMSSRVRDAVVALAACHNVRTACGYI